MLKNPRHYLILNTEPILTKQSRTTLRISTRFYPKKLIDISPSAWKHWCHRHTLESNIRVEGCSHSCVGIFKEDEHRTCLKTIVIHLRKWRTNERVTNTKWDESNTWQKTKWTCRFILMTALTIHDNMKLQYFIVLYT